MSASQSSQHGLSFEQLGHIPPGALLGDGVAVIRPLISASPSYRARLNSLGRLEGVEPFCVEQDAARRSQISTIQIASDRQLAEALEAHGNVSVRTAMATSMLAGLMEVAKNVPSLLGPLSITPTIPTDSWVETVWRLRKPDAAHPQEYAYPRSFNLVAAIWRGRNRLIEECAKTLQSLASVALLQGIEGPVWTPALKLVSIEKRGSRSDAARRIAECESLTRGRALARMTLVLGPARIVPRGLTKDFWESIE